MRRNRYFPLPDYDLSELSKVQVKIIGKVLDLNYTKTLINHTDLDLSSVFLLDKVQKKQTITQEGAKQLRNMKLIEGKYPNIYISSNVAAVVNDKATYILNKAFDDTYYIDLIRSYITEYGVATRPEIDSLILNKLSESLEENQKKKKVDNLIQKMKKESIIANKGTSRKSEWILINK